MPLFAPPIREYDGRETLRSFADALEIARELDGLSDQEALVAKVWSFEYCGHRIGFVIFAGPKRADTSMLVIPMPSSGSFVGLTAEGDRLPFPIHLLNDALGYGSGEVRLVNDRVFRNVDLRLSTLPEFTRTDERIVELAVKFLQVRDQCYREPDPEEFPGFSMLDYALLPGIQIERLKPVQHYVMKHLPDVPPSRVALALRRAGMQFPRWVTKRAA